jgi:cytochrome c biogenesis protein CcdA
MTLATLGLAFLAGLLSTLSPCVLPLLPIVIGAAATEHRLGPVALAVGLALSFVAIGMFVATLGFAVGLDGDVFRLIAALLLMALGFMLMVPRLQHGLATAAGPAANWASTRMATVNQEGWTGQFVVGLLLGAVWSPCVGPTLGAASVLAAQGESLGAVALTMTTFAFGAALPLLLVGLMSRELVMSMRGRMMAAGAGLKAVLGGLLVVVGAMIATGLDKVIEAELVARSPEWLTRLTTSY